jgi:protease I
MNQSALSGIRVAILASNGFEPSELFEPKKALEDAGAQVDVVSPDTGSVKSWNHKGWGKAIDVNVSVNEADPDNYQALMLPGGVINPDHLRIDRPSVEFVQSFVDAGKPIAAICHGPQLLIETGAVRGKQMTSWPSLKTDLTNAGAHWVDQEVVNDHGLITSRKPEDIPAFSRAMIAEFADGQHERPSPSEKAYPVDSGHA